ncbi:hypothetical protein CR513_18084, partial [Mucuna pruriens]
MSESNNTKIRGIQKIVQVWDCIAKDRLKEFISTTYANKIHLLFSSSSLKNFKIIQLGGNYLRRNKETWNKPINIPIKQIHKMSNEVESSKLIHAYLENETPANCRLNYLVYRKVTLEREKIKYKSAKKLFCNKKKGYQYSLKSSLYKIKTH